MSEKGAKKADRTIDQSHTKNRIESDKLSQKIQENEKEQVRRAEEGEPDPTEDPRSLESKRQREMQED